MGTGRRGRGEEKGKKGRGEENGGRKEGGGGRKEGEGTGKEGGRKRRRKRNLGVYLECMKRTRRNERESGTIV